MTDLEKLKLHLDNLKKEGHKTFDVDVNWLLNILNELPNKTNINVPKEFYIDGGTF